jgi:hypothetical protein
MATKTTKRVRAAEATAESEAEAPETKSDIEPTFNPKGEMMWESSPSRYIAKISLNTRKEILRPIDPEELLVHAHRDKNPVEVTAQFLASRAIQLTGNEDVSRTACRMNALVAPLPSRRQAPPD